MYLPAESRYATQSRSASGSFAKTKSALFALAVSIDSSMAPGSSGFGKVTVGKEPSGLCCEATGISGSIPEISKIFSMN